jgi:hypothetical protein
MPAAKEKESLNKSHNLLLGRVDDPAGSGYAVDDLAGSGCAVDDLAGGAKATIVEVVFAAFCWPLFVRMRCPFFAIFIP